MKEAVIYLGFFSSIVLLSIGLYKLGKTISYEFMYEDMVIKTIQERVKASCLEGNI